jgi:phosphoribosyl 1,2-cyclic phosphate phosphodiesterase
MSTLRVTILGCGSSGGVPRADGDWGACDPADPRNARTRCGLLLQRWAGPAEDTAHATTVLIDTSPDLRVQLIAQAITHIDAVVFSHEHADQTHGIDDVRAIAYRQRRAIPTFMDAATASVLRPRFAYVFDGAGGYPAIMHAQPLIEPFRPFSITGPGGPITLEPIVQDHGASPSLGFRIGDFAYSNDVHDLPAESLARLEGLSLWIVDALSYTPHPTHAHVDKALGWAVQLKPRRTVLTNLHIDLDFTELAGRLPPNVEPAYDGWSADLDQ